MTNICIAFNATVDQTPLHLVRTPKLRSLWMASKLPRLFVVS